jgi:cytochrome c oxidase subunit 2
MAVQRTIRVLAVWLLAVGLESCRQPQSTLNAQGPAARNLAHIGWFVYILFGAVTAIMWGLLLWAAVRKHGTLTEHEPWDTGGGQGWIWVGGFAIPFLVLAGVFVFATERMNEFPIGEHAHYKPQIQVIGHQWWWEVRYIGGPPDTHFVTANEIHIPAGEPVDFELDTRDVIHSFWIPSLHGKVDMVPGQPNSVRLEADHPGSYPGQCAEFCGAQHAHMRLLVVADAPDAYREWVRGQLQSSAGPNTEEEARGQSVFLSTACALCHTIRGTPAAGLVGPDLTHLASRRGIAANSYSNNDANLEAWVTHAQSLKPAVVMPNLTQYNGTDLRALVAYLRRLK